MERKKDKTSKANDLTIMQAHDAADQQGLPTYTDPISGYLVFTRSGLLAQKKCCGSGCRHCPYGQDE